MSKVFVAGATGIIGGAIASLFQTKGWTVYGLCRSEDKAKTLTKQEIIPVIANGGDVEKWEKIAASCSVIIEALSDMKDYSTAAKVQKALHGIAKANSNITIIYTSGIWVYGNSKVGEESDENTPVNPPPLVASRPAFEKEYLSFGANVVRPGILYGKSGSLFAYFVGLIEGGKPLPGNGESVWSAIHCDELAEIYYKIAERGLRSQLFNGVSNLVTVKEVAHAIASVLGKGEVKWAGEPKDPFSECLALSQRISSSKAQHLLGWNPSQASFTAAAKKYVDAMKAHQ